MKYKSKPIHKVEIREAVERKFQARGALIFHACLLLIGTALFLAYLPTAWSNLLSFRWDNALADSAMLYGVLALSFALNFFRYHFRHGAGYEKHQAETAARINRRLGRTAPDEWEDQEELIRIQQRDKLRNRRLLWQHLAVFLSFGFTLFFSQLSIVAREGFSDWSAISAGLNVMGVWGIGMLAHSLRFYLAYGASPEKRQARIDAEVARELADMAAARRRRDAAAARRAVQTGSADEDEYIAAERFAAAERESRQAGS